MPICIDCTLLLVILCFDRIIHEGGFTRDDNKTYIPLVRSNTIQALVAIIRAMATLHVDFADGDREVFCCLTVACLIQSNLTISKLDNSNSYRDRTVVPATSHCNRRENASDLSNTGISNSWLYRVSSAAPHMSMASFISKLTPNFGLKRV